MDPKDIRKWFAGTIFFLSFYFAVLASPLFAQTQTLYQHKLAGGSACEKTLTCTVTLSSPTVAGHALLLGIAGAGTSGYPVAGAPSGDSTWTHCPNGYGKYEDSPTDWQFTDCYYILSAAGGATSISVTFSGQTAAQLMGVDVEVMEVSCSSSCTASYDTSNFKSSSAQCSTCSSEVLTLTGTNDAILQIANFVEAYKSVASPYILLDDDTDSASNTFAYVLNSSSGATVNWTQSSAEQALFTGLALKFSPGNTYYISSAIGSDSNTATQAQNKATPWAHLPGMVNCSANCASFAPVAGDQFILRGGDTWNSSSLGINWQWSGTSTLPIYIGVDPTWFAGSAWTRPVWTCGGAACSGTGPQVNFFNTGNSFVTVDNIEVTGLYSNAASQPDYFNVSGENDIFEHIYAHGWSHDTAANGAPDSSYVFNFNAAYNTTGGVVHDSVIDGSDTTEDSMGCFTGAPPTAYNNVCEYVTNGFAGAGSNIHDNWFGPIVTSFVYGLNQNALFQAGPDNAATSVFLYNNVIADSTCSVCGAVVKLGLSASNSNTATGYAFNNVLFDNAPGSYLNLGGPSAANYGTWYFFNNTLECGTDAATGACGSDATGSSGMIFAFNSQNNHYITSASPANSCSFSTCSSTTDLTQTVTTANAQGYTSASTDAFQPTSVSGSTVAAGTNAQSICTTITSLNAAAGTACQSDTSYACSYNTMNHTVSCPDRTGDTRPVSSRWDIGAYQAVFAPSITIQPMNQTVTAGQTATFTVTATGTAPLSYLWQENGTAITGAPNAASYTTPVTTTANSGEKFSVVVSNSASSAASNSATLTVNAATTIPVISLEPANQTVDVGQTATFTVAATGYGTLTYQWKSGGTSIRGATKSSYTTAATAASNNGTLYTVVVTDSLGSVTSSAATLFVLSPSMTTTCNWLADNVTWQCNTVTANIPSGTSIKTTVTSDGVTTTTTGTHP